MPTKKAQGRVFTPSLCFTIRAQGSIRSRIYDPCPYQEQSPKNTLHDARIAVYRMSARGEVIGHFAEKLRQDHTHVGFPLFRGGLVELG